MVESDDLVNVEISFVGYYGYSKEISISDLVCRANIDDRFILANLWRFFLRDCTVELRWLEH